MNSISENVIPETNEVPDIIEINEYRDLMGQYLKDISIYPRLTIEEEYQLSKTVLTNKNPKEVKIARDRLIVSNLKLVIKFAVLYSRIIPDSSNLTVMDLVTTGNMALIRAAERFDSQKSKFGTFASMLIKQGIFKSIREEGYLIRKPHRHFSILSDIQKLKDIDNNISDQEIKEKLHLSDRRIKRAQTMVYTNNAVEFDEMIEKGEIKCEEPSHLGIPERIARTELLNIITKKLKLLPPKLRDIFLRHSMGGETLEGIAKTYGITREAVRIKYLYAARKIKSILRLHFEQAIADTITREEGGKLDDRRKVSLRRIELRKKREEAYKSQKNGPSGKKYSKLNDKEYMKLYRREYAKKRREKGKNENRGKGRDQSDNGNEFDQKDSNRRNYKIRQSASFVQSLLKEQEGGDKPKPSGFDQICKEIN